MEKAFRGDTLPVVVRYKNYTLGAGDVVTVGIFNEEWEEVGRESLKIEHECDAVQIELEPSKTYNALGNCVVEVRLITASGLEVTMQKKIRFEEDGLR